MGLIWFALLLTLQQSSTLQKMAGMVCYSQKCLCLHGLFRIIYLFVQYNQNPWGCYHCTTTSICVILKVTMTGLVSHTNDIGNFFLILKWLLVWTYLCNNRISSTLVSRVVSLSLCSRKECFISGSLDRTVLLWDQRVEKCQVEAFAYRCSFSKYVLYVTKISITCKLGSFTRTRKACYGIWWTRTSLCNCLWRIH